jgi:hypothetical protein
MRHYNKRNLILILHLLGPRRRRKCSSQSSWAIAGRRVVPPELWSTGNGQCHVAGVCSTRQGGVSVMADENSMVRLCFDFLFKAGEKL